MKRHAWLFALSLLLAFPAAAQVVRGYASVQLNLRAGPDIGYPVVDLLPLGAPLYVHGCTADWAWCDVSVFDERGWVAGDFIDYPYQRRWVSVYNYGAVIGIPVVHFVIGNYWFNHYRHRSFYHHRSYWYHHRFAYRPVPRYPHHRRRFSHAFHDRVLRDRDDHRRYIRHHDRDRYDRYDRRDDGHRVTRQRSHTASHRGHGDRDHDRRRLAPTVARHAAPRHEHVRSRAPQRSQHNQRRHLAAAHPVPQRRVYSAPRNVRHSTGPRVMPAARMQHRDNRQHNSRASSQRSHAQNKRRHHKRHERH